MDTAYVLGLTISSEASMIAVASGASGGLPNMYYIVFWGQVCVRNQYGAGSLMKNIAIAYGL